MSLCGLQRLLHLELPPQKLTCPLKKDHLKRRCHLPTINLKAIYHNIFVSSGGKLIHIQGKNLGIHRQLLAPSLVTLHFIQAVQFAPEISKKTMSLKSHKYFVHCRCCFFFFLRTFQNPEIWGTSKALVFRWSWMNDHEHYSDTSCPSPSTTLLKMGSSLPMFRLKTIPTFGLKGNQKEKKQPQLTPHHPSNRLSVNFEGYPP